MPKTISNADDVIDSRDVIARISELEDELQAAHEEEQGEAPTIPFDAWLKTAADTNMHTLQSEAQELLALRSVAEDAEGYCPDWRYGATLVRDSYFERYAREFANDIGAIKNDSSWPYTCIDWSKAASELQEDYTSVEYDGITYWVR